MTRSLSPYIAAAHLESAAVHLTAAAEELTSISLGEAFELHLKAADLRIRAARLEADERAQLAADEAGFRAYDEAHPQPHGAV